MLADHLCMMEKGNNRWVWVKRRLLKYRMLLQQVASHPISCFPKKTRARAQESSDLQWWAYAQTPANQTKPSEVTALFAGLQGPELVGGWDGCSTHIHRVGVKCYCTSDPFGPPAAAAGGELLQVDPVPISPPIAQPLLGSIIVLVVIAVKINHVQL